MPDDNEPIIEDLVPRDDGLDDEWVSTSYSPDSNISIKIYSSIYNKNGTLINDNISRAIKPGEDFQLRISTTDISNSDAGKKGYYIRVATEYDTYNYKLTNAGTNKYINLQMQNLKSTTGTLTVSAIVVAETVITVIDEEQHETTETVQQIYEVPSSYVTINGVRTPQYNTRTFINSYIPPLQCEKIESKIERCTKNGTQSDDGKYLFLSQLKLKLNSGIINQYKQLVIEANIVNYGISKNVTLIDNNNEAIEILWEMTGDGYTRQLNGQSSFQSNLFYNLESEIENDESPLIINKDSIINLIISYKYYDDDSIEPEKFFISNLQTSNMYQVLTLVGKTIVNNAEIFGGLSIGQESTVKQKKKPIFECGYPAYFSGQPFGYYSGELVSFSQNTSFFGVCTGYSGQFSIFLGQPIFSTKVAIGGYLTAYVNKSSSSYGSYNVSNIKLNGINMRTGIISFSFELSGSSSSYGPVILLPSPQFQIHFL